MVPPALHHQPLRPPGHQVIGFQRGLQIATVDATRCAHDHVLRSFHDLAVHPQQVRLLQGFETSEKPAQKERALLKRCELKHGKESPAMENLFRNIMVSHGIPKSGILWGSGSPVDRTRFSGRNVMRRCEPAASTFYEVAPNSPTIPLEYQIIQPWTAMTYKSVLKPMVATTHPPRSPHINPFQNPEVNRGTEIVIA